MKKLSEGLYLYKGIEVVKLSNGNYKGTAYFGNDKLPTTIVGATQAGFKRMVNLAIKDYGAIREAK